MNYLIGRLCELLGIPPMVARLERQTIMGKEVEIRTSPRYTILVVDGLELYFNRESGKYDGYAVQGPVTSPWPQRSEVS